MQSDVRAQNYLVPSWQLRSPCVRGTGSRFWGCRVDGCYPTLMDSFCRTLLGCLNFLSAKPFRGPVTSAHAHSRRRCFHHLAPLPWFPPTLQATRPFSCIYTLDTRLTSLRVHKLARERIMIAGDLSRFVEGAGVSFADQVNCASRCLDSPVHRSWPRSLLDQAAAFAFQPCYSRKPRAMYDPRASVPFAAVETAWPALHSRDIDL